MVYDTFPLACFIYLVSTLPSSSKSSNTEFIMMHVNQLRGWLPARRTVLQLHRLQSLQIRAISQSDALSSRRVNFLNNGLSAEQREKRLTETMKDVNKHFGAGSLMNLGDNARVEGVGRGFVVLLRVLLHIYATSLEPITGPIHSHGHRHP